MYKFPKDLFTDVRIETTSKTDITYEDGELKQNKNKVEKGVFIRIFDGKIWYYSSITEVGNIQHEIDELAKMAKRNKYIYNHAMVIKLQVNKGEYFKYKHNNIKDISNQEKVELLKGYLNIFTEFKEVLKSKIYYKDTYITKQIISSKGTDVIFDVQNAFIAMRYSVVSMGRAQGGRGDIYESDFRRLYNREDFFRSEIKKNIEYVKGVSPVKKGKYTCIFSPITAGIFAHESFGHKSEADFIIGDTKLMEEWSIGSMVGAPILSIIDSGQIEGSGYVPFDDEGTKSCKTYLIKDGVLKGRLHSTYTASALKEELTGNARAMSFQYEPIVRMTTTYIGAGNLTREELFKDIKEGIYIDEIKHGSGMSTFTIAPSRAYMIRDGKIAEPVCVSVITGDVMETLNKITGVSNTVEIEAFGLGGCGKMEQYPLSVGFGGPYIRLNEIEVS